MSLSALHADIAARYDRLNQSISKGKIKPEQAAVLSDRYAWPVSKDGTLGMGQHASAERKYIDSVEASCPFIISTQDEDSDGDIVVSRGADLSRFALNPVVLLGHGSYQMPIGTARAKDGTISVWPEENRVRANCYFDMPDPDSAAVYGKVERGILNATSISFLPLQAHKREYDKAHHDGMMPPGWLFQRWQLTEFSIVSVPANAGAVRDWLDSDKDLSPKLQKALQPFAAVAKGCFNGYCPCPPCDKAWDEADHPRGQPENAGQFGPASGVPSTDSESAKVASEDYKNNGTKAKAFKEWFGDSKVVDKKGKPLAVYHGAQSDFDEFDSAKAGSNASFAGNGFYFSENEKIARSYSFEDGKIIEAYLKVKNPFDFKASVGEDGLRELAKKVSSLFQKEGVTKDQLEQKLLGAFGVDGSGKAEAISGYFVHNSIASVIGSKNVNSVIEKLGHDGIKYSSMNAAGTPRASSKEKDLGLVWVAFGPKQIKSVDNDGTFDPDSPNIRKKAKYESHLGQFLHAQRVKDMTKKQNAAVLTSGLPGAKACHKSYCACKSCKSVCKSSVNGHFITYCSCGKVIAQCRCTSKDKIKKTITDGCSECKRSKGLPEEEDAVSGAEASGTNPERHEHEEEGAEHEKTLQESVAAKMPKLMECGYTEPQAMCLAAHLHGKGLEGEDITGHEEAAKALGYTKKDDMGGEESMSLKSFVKSVKKESDSEALDESHEGETESASEGEEADEEEEEKPQYKPSAKCLGAMHNHMKLAHDFLSKEIPVMDHPQLSKAMTAHVKDLEGHMENYKDLAGKYHPDLDFEKMCKDLGGEGGEAEEESNETGAGESSEASSEEGDGRKTDDESPAEKVQEYQHPKGAKRRVQKAMMDHGCVKEAADYMAEASRDATMPRTHKAAMSHHCSALTGYCKAIETTPAEPVREGDPNEVPPEAMKKVAERFDQFADLIFLKTGQRF